METGHTGSNPPGANATSIWPSYPQVSRAFTTFHNGVLCVASLKAKASLVCGGIAPTKSTPGEGKPLQVASDRVEGRRQLRAHGGHGGDDDNGDKRSDQG
jgi:hypothetical protein